jgi:UDP-glucose 4-epimerase
VTALAELAQHPAAVGQVFNVGNTEEITMNDLAHLIKQMTSSESEIIHIPYERAYEKGFEDMPRRVPDIGKVRRLIGYKPKLSLKEILTEVIASMRQNMPAVAIKVGG